ATTRIREERLSRLLTLCRTSLLSSTRATRMAIKCSIDFGRVNWTGRWIVRSEAPAGDDRGASAWPAGDGQGGADDLETMAHVGQAAPLAFRRPVRLETAPVIGDAQL